MKYIEVGRIFFHPCYEFSDEKGSVSRIEPKCSELMVPYKNNRNKEEEKNEKEKFFHNKLIKHERDSFQVQGQYRGVGL
jgi:hypothetical protein